MRLSALQEATPEEVQAYRRTIRALYAESDKLDAAAVKSGNRSLRELQKRISDRLEGLRARGQLTPRLLGEVQKEVQALTGAWAKELIQEHRATFGPRAYQIGDQLATKGVGAAGLHLLLHPRSDLDLAQSVQLKEKFAYRAAEEATAAALKLVRIHALGGRNWDEVQRQLVADPSKGQSYWFRTLTETEAATRTWAAQALSDGALRRLEELHDRTAGAVKMLFVLHDTKGACKKCTPHSGKVYNIRGGQAPRLPLHPECRCSYLPYYERGADVGRPDSVMPTPAGAKDFEGILGVPPSERYAYLNREARPVLDSPFDERGLSYAADALEQPAPGIPPTKDYAAFLAKHPQIVADDGKPVRFESAVKDHVIADHSSADAQMRVAWLEALPRLLSKPEFSGRPDKGKRCWIGRFKLQGETKFAIAYAVEGQSSYTLESYWAFQSVRSAKRRVEALQSGSKL